MNCGVAIWYKPDVIKGDMDSIRTEVLAFYKNMGTKIVDEYQDQDTTDLHKCVAFIRDFHADTEDTIFQKAISTSNAYIEQFRELVQVGKDTESAYWELVVKDIQDACKLFESICDQTDGGDGYVSVEVSPDDTEGTVEAAKWLHKVVDRSNVYIKIPATAECAFN